MNTTWMDLESFSSPSMWNNRLLDKEHTTFFILNAYNFYTKKKITLNSFKIKYKKIFHSGFEACSQVHFNITNTIHTFIKRKNLLMMFYALKKAKTGFKSLRVGCMYNKFLMNTDMSNRENRMRMEFVCI